MEHVFYGSKKEQQELVNLYKQKLKDYIKITLDYIPAIETGEKPVLPELAGLIGTYQVGLVTIPKWYIDAMYAFNEYIDDNATEEVKTKIYADAEHYNTTGNLPDEPSHFIQAVQNYNNITLKNFEDGVFPNGQRISKYLKKVCELTLGKTKDHMQSEWAKLIEKNTAQSGITVVFSNAIMSLIGKSLYLENGMSSCQSFTKGGNEGHSRQIDGDLLDPNSIICYVTNGTMVAPLNVSSGPKHPVMKERMMIRLVQSKDGKSKGIMVDRSYPKSTYGNQIYSVIMDYCVKNDLMFFEPESYNRAKEGVETPITITKPAKTTPNHYVYDFEPWIVPFCKYKTVKGCEENRLKELSPCHSCKPVNKDVCGVCKDALKLHEQIQEKCSACRKDTCTNPTKDCCRCAMSLCDKHGYKDNAARDENSIYGYEGKFRDRYKVVNMELTPQRKG